MKRISKLFILVVSLTLIAGAWSCRTPAGRTAGEVVDDATITTKVKALIFDDPDLSGLAISVETFEGEVTLTGAVPVEQDIRKAESLARSVYGVKRVKNLLKIKK